MRRAQGIVAALALLGGLAACTSAPEPELVGAYGDLHVAPGGSMEFCAFSADPGLDGLDEPCFDGIETAGIDPAALKEALGGFVIVDRVDDRRWAETAPQTPRRAPDGTLTGEPVAIPAGRAAPSEDAGARVARAVLIIRSRRG
ncbi:hypothetical protein NB037_11395 [Rathayibacter sp. ZW T2_19]|uniref:Lipoprotein n=1 Tax=Rathayibacter rubneri TaxID=2950106 RepID=A0A9X2DXK2_9MICO|nr:hypothetical protein [Rathayibacter rubneri]MCM6763022.1 hypothetical protein [Rathayibacter rubneri]